MAQAPRGTAGLEECAEAATQLGQKILFHLSSRECKWSNKLLSAQVMLYKKVVMPESDTLCILERETPAVASGRALLRPGLQTFVISSALQNLCQAH